MRLKAIATPAAREPGPLVTRVRSLTVAKVDSIGLVTGMKGGGCRLRHGSAGRCFQLAEEYGATVRDRGIWEQTQVGQAGDRSMGREPELVHGRPCDWPWVAAGPIPGVRPGVPQPPREVVSAAPRVPFHKIVEWDATAGQFAYDPNYDQKQPDWT
jgi:hypothetical protein